MHQMTNSYTHSSGVEPRNITILVDLFFELLNQSSHHNKSINILRDCHRTTECATLSGQSVFLMSMLCRNGLSSVFWWGILFKNELSNHPIRKMSLPNMKTYQINIGSPYVLINHTKIEQIFNYIFCNAPP